jgi:hypothetical protein
MKSVLQVSGIKPTEKLTSAVKNYPVPKTNKQIKQFLGLASYYRKFIDNFAKIVLPLTRQLKADLIFKWNAEMQHAFEEIKYKLTHAPLLQFPCFDGRLFILTTDSSNFKKIKRYRT